MAKLGLKTTARRSRCTPTPPASQLLLPILDSGHTGSRAAVRGGAGQPPADLPRPRPPGPPPPPGPAPHLLHHLGGRVQVDQALVHAQLEAVPARSAGQATAAAEE